MNATKLASSFPLCPFTERSPYLAPTILTRDFHLDTFFNSIWMSGPHVFNFNPDGTVNIPQGAEPTPAPRRHSSKVPSSVNKPYAAAAKSRTSRQRSCDKPWKNISIVEQDDAEFEEWQARMASTREKGGDTTDDGVPVYAWSPGYAVPQSNLEQERGLDDEADYGDENVPPEILHGGSPTASASTEDSPLIRTPTRCGNGIRKPLAVLYEALVEPEDGALEKVVGFERLRRKAPRPLCLDEHSQVGDGVDRIDGILLTGDGEHTAHETEMLSPLTTAFGISKLTAGVSAMSMLQQTRAY